MKKLLYGTQQYAVIKAIVTHPHMSIIEIRRYVGSIYRNCSQLKITNAMKAFDITFDGSFNFSQELVDQLAQVESDNVPKKSEKVNIIGTPEMKPINMQWSMREGALDYRNIPSRSL